MQAAGLHLSLPPMLQLSAVAVTFSVAAVPSCAFALIVSGTTAHVLL